MSRVLRGCLVLVFVVWAPALLLAQTTGQSAIAGVVRDASGAVLPGVSVEASSPVLIEKTRAVVTDGEGRYTIVNLRPGTYKLTCAEFCGADHSVMGGSFIVMSKADYANWLQSSDVDQSLAQQGAALFRSHGCSGCHGPASTVHAPSLDGLYGKPVPLSDGTIQIADERFIRDSILKPHSKVAAGYEPLMPSYEGKISEDELVPIVAYIKSLADNARPPL